MQLGCCERWLRGTGWLGKLVSRGTQLNVGWPAPAWGLHCWPRLCPSRTPASAGGIRSSLNVPYIQSKWSKKRFRRLAYLCVCLYTCVCVYICIPPRLQLHLLWRLWLWVTLLLQVLTLIALSTNIANKRRLSNRAVWWRVCQMFLTK